MNIITIKNDYTTFAIAKQAKIINNSPSVNGADIIVHSPEELIELSRETTLYTRMFPKAKLAMIIAFKEEAEAVAMFADGVNDATAWNASHIRVAMGPNGAELAQAAAS